MKRKNSTPRRAPAAANRRSSRRMKSTTTPRKPTSIIHDKISVGSSSASPENITAANSKTSNDSTATALTTQQRRGSNNSNSGKTNEIVNNKIIESGESSSKKRGRLDAEMKSKSNNHDEKRSSNKHNYTAIVETNEMSTTSSSYRNNSKNSRPRRRSSLFDKLPKQPLQQQILLSDSMLPSHSQITGESSRIKNDEDSSSRVVVKKRGRSSIGSSNQSSSLFAKELNKTTATNNNTMSSFASVSTTKSASLKWKRKSFSELSQSAAAFSLSRASTSIAVAPASAIATEESATEIAEGNNDQFTPPRIKSSLFSSPSRKNESSNNTNNNTGAFLSGSSESTSLFSNVMKRSGNTPGSSARKRQKRFFTSVSTAMMKTVDEEQQQQHDGEVSTNVNGNNNNSTATTLAAATPAESTNSASSGASWLNSGYTHAALNTNIGSDDQSSVLYEMAPPPPQPPQAGPLISITTPEKKNDSYSATPLSPPLVNPSRVALLFSSPHKSQTAASFLSTPQRITAAAARAASLVADTILRTPQRLAAAAASTVTAPPSSLKRRLLAFTSSPGKKLQPSPSAMRLIIPRDNIGNGVSSVASISSKEGNLKQQHLLRTPLSPPKVVVMTSSPFTIPSTTISTTSTASQVLLNTNDGSTPATVDASADKKKSLANTTMNHSSSPNKNQTINFEDNNSNDTSHKEKYQQQQRHVHMSAPTSPPPSTPKRVVALTPPITSPSDNNNTKVRPLSAPGSSFSSPKASIASKQHAHYLQTPPGSIQSRRHATPQSCRSTPGGYQLLRMLDMSSTHFADEEEEDDDENENENDRTLQTNNEADKVLSPSKDAMELEEEAVWKHAWICLSHANTATSHEPHQTQKHSSQTEFEGIGVMDWSIKSRMTIECCYPPNKSIDNNNIPKNESLLQLENCYKLERAAKCLFATNSASSTTQQQQNHSSLTIKEKSIAQWKAGLLYYQHPSIHPMPQSILQSVADSRAKEQQLLFPAQKKQQQPLRGFDSIHSTTSRQSNNVPPIIRQMQQQQQQLRNQHQQQQHGVTSTNNNNSNNVSALAAESPLPQQSFAVLSKYIHSTSKSLLKQMRLRTLGCLGGLGLSFPFQDMKQPLEQLTLNQQKGLKMNGWRNNLRNKPQDYNGSNSQFHLQQQQQRQKQQQKRLQQEQQQLNQMITSREAEWKECFRDLYTNWMHKIELYNNIKNHNHTASTGIDNNTVRTTLIPAHPTSLPYFYSITSGQIVLFHSSTTSLKQKQQPDDNTNSATNMKSSTKVQQQGGKGDNSSDKSPQDPQILFSTTTQQFRQCMKRMGVNLQFIKSDGKSRCVYQSESKLEDFLGIDYSTNNGMYDNNNDDENINEHFPEKYREELNALRRESSCGVGGEIMVKMQIKEQQQLDANAKAIQQQRQELEKMRREQRIHAVTALITGKDDCHLVYEMFWNCTGRVLHQQLNGPFGPIMAGRPLPATAMDVPLLLCRQSMGGSDAHGGGVCSTNMTLRPLSVTMNTNSDTSTNNNDTIENTTTNSHNEQHQQQQQCKIEIRGPILPCAVGELLNAISKRLVCDKEEKEVISHYSSSSNNSNKNSTNKNDLTTHANDYSHMTSATIHHVSNTSNKNDPVIINNKLEQQDKDNDEEKDIGSHYWVATFKTHLGEEGLDHQQQTSVLHGRTKSLGVIGGSSSNLSSSNHYPSSNGQEFLLNSATSAAMTTGGPSSSLFNDVHGNDAGDDAGDNGAVPATNFDVVDDTHAVHNCPKNTVLSQAVWDITQPHVMTFKTKIAY